MSSRSSTVDWVSVFAKETGEKRIQEKKAKPSGIQVKIGGKEQAFTLLEEKQKTRKERAYGVAGKVCKVLAITSFGLVLISVTTGGVFAAEPITQVVDVTTTTEAGTDGSWADFIKTILKFADYLMDGVIIFAGASWMFGNRTKAIELLFSSGIGYVIMRHYDDIKRVFAML